MKIFAHRGFSHKFPEGSRAAYEGAVNAGADGFECDVRLIRGGEIICFHDRTTRRLTGKMRLISRMTAEEIKEIYDAITLQELLEIALKEYFFRSPSPFIPKTVQEATGEREKISQPAPQSFLGYLE